MTALGHEHRFWTACNSSAYPSIADTRADIASNPLSPHAMPSASYSIWRLKTRGAIGRKGERDRIPFVRRGDVGPRISALLSSTSTADTSELCHERRFRDVSEHQSFSPGTLVFGRCHQLWAGFDTS
jgi:hypothetical protein